MLDLLVFRLIVYSWECGIFKDSIVFVFVKICFLIWGLDEMY